MGAGAQEARRWWRACRTGVVRWRRLPGVMPRKQMRWQEGNELLALQGVSSPDPVRRAVEGSGGSGGQAAGDDGGAAPASGHQVASCRMPRCTAADDVRRRACSDSVGAFPGAMWQR